MNRNNLLFLSEFCSLSDVLIIRAVSCFSARITSQSVSFFPEKTNNVFVVTPISWLHNLDLVLHFTYSHRWHPVYSVVPQCVVVVPRLAARCHTQCWKWSAATSATLLHNVCLVLKREASETAQFWFHLGLKLSNNSIALSDSTSKFVSFLAFQWIFSLFHRISFRLVNWCSRTVFKRIDFEKRTYQSNKNSHRPIRLFFIFIK